MSKEKIIFLIFLAQIIIKFVPPLLADFVIFCSQLKPWFEGESFFEERFFNLLSERAIGDDDF